MANFFRVCLEGLEDLFSPIGEVLIGILGFSIILKEELLRLYFVACLLGIAFLLVGWWFSLGVNFVIGLVVLVLLSPDIALFLAVLQDPGEYPREWKKKEFP